METRLAAVPAASTLWEGPRGPALQPRLERPLGTTALTSARAGAAAGYHGTGLGPARPPSSSAPEALGTPVHTAPLKAYHHRQLGRDGPWRCGDAFVRPFVTQAERRPPRRREREARGSLPRSGSQFTGASDTPAVTSVAVSVPPPTHIVERQGPLGPPLSQSEDGESTRSLHGWRVLVIGEAGPARGEAGPAEGCGRSEVPGGAAPRLVKNGCGLSAPKTADSAG